MSEISAIDLRATSMDFVNDIGDTSHSCPCVLGCSIIVFSITVYVHVLHYCVYR